MIPTDETEMLLARLVATAADSYFSKDMSTYSVNPGMRTFALSLTAYRAHLKTQRTE